MRFRPRAQSTSDRIRASSKIRTDGEDRLEDRYKLLSGTGVALAGRSQRAHPGRRGPAHVAIGKDVAGIIPSGS